jgi:ClpP class serine protease
LYARFLEVVATGRKRPVAEIEALAGGRVWSGKAAREHGLVDELGGIDRALELAREQLDTLPAELRDSLQLRACTGKGEGGALPPSPERERVPAVPLSWLEDLSFLIAAQREPAAYYAWGLSGYAAEQAPWCAATQVPLGRFG